MGTQMGLVLRLAMMIEPPKPEEYVIPREKSPYYSPDDLRRVLNQYEIDEKRIKIPIDSKGMVFLVKLCFKMNRLDFAVIFIRCLEHVGDLPEQTYALRVRLEKEVRKTQALLKIKQRQQVQKQKNDDPVVKLERREKVGKSPLSESHVVIYQHEEEAVYNGGANGGVCRICETKQDMAERSEAKLVFYPCRHTVFCQSCFEMIYAEEIKSGEEKYCPVCEDEILTVLNKDLLDL